MKQPSTSMLIIAILALVVTATAHSQQQKAGKNSFGDYPAVVYKGPKANVNRTSNKLARQYKTMIAEAYQSNKTQFAGYYIVSTRGCGAGCVMGAIVDMKSGKVYDLPWQASETDEVYFNGGYDFKPDSRLLIATVWKQAKQLDEHHYFIWDEAKHRFAANGTATEPSDPMEE